nr:unnamed protein product [Digitaria exilis]
MGFDVGEDNIVTASLEDLSSEDHERFMALQKHLEAEFLKTFRKGHPATTQYVQTEHGQCKWFGSGWICSQSDCPAGQTVATGGHTACSGGQPNLTNAMVFVPEQPLPLSTVPDSVSAGRAAGLLQAVRPAAPGGQTACPHGRPKMLIPKRAEVGTWKMNVAKEQGVQKPKVTFDMLYDKYTKQKAVPSDRPLKRRMRSPIQTRGFLRLLTTRQGQPPRVPPRQVYRPKRKEEVQSMDAVQTACHLETAAQAVRPPVQAVRPGDAQAPSVSSSSFSARDGKSTSVLTAEDDDELVDYSSSPERMNVDVNLIKTNMTVSGIEGGEPIGAKGVISLELTIGSKTLATAFFVAETQGGSTASYSQSDRHGRSNRQYRRSDRLHL